MYYVSETLWEVPMKYNVLLLLTAFFININSAFADAPPRMIAVSGEAREEVQPDQAVLSGQLVSKAKKLSAAKEENDKLANRLLAIAKQFDIPKDKISASNVYISPEYVWNQAQNKQDQVGYIVTRNLSITMDKLDVHERVLSALIDNGIDQVNGVNFTLAHPEALADKLRVKAVKNARARAEMMAEAAGAKLGKVIMISAGGAMPPPMPMMEGRMLMAMSKAADSAPAPSLPGVITFQENVSVTFELE